MPSKLDAQLDELLRRMGFELVTLDRSGGRGSSLRLRIDRPGGEPGASGVTVDDCTRVAREVREFLEERTDVPASYSLEVSSPGVERPLVRPRDYERFAGREVRLKGYGPLADGARRLEGVLVGLADGEEEPGRVVVRVSEERVEVPLSDIAKATLVYRWEDDL